jgi:ribosome-associated heat shock protein Hsp15
MAEAGAAVRIDKWLWAARLLKTRSLAADAVKGGRVHVNGERVKASKEVRPGDQVEVAFGQGRRVTVDVLGVAERRGPASVAAELYSETDESRERREQMAAERRVAAGPDPRGGVRPTKRDRRRYEAAKRGEASRRAGRRSS